MNPPGEGASQSAKENSRAGTSPGTPAGAGGQLCSAGVWVGGSGKQAPWRIRALIRSGFALSAVAAATSVVGL